MATRQPEIARQLDDGFVIARDMTVVPRAVQREFGRVASRQMDLMLKVLRDDGSDFVTGGVEARDLGESASKARQKRRFLPKER
jgi:hypothetical protein